LFWFLKQKEHYPWGQAKTLFFLTAFVVFAWRIQANPAKKKKCALWKPGLKGRFFNKIV